MPSPDHNMISQLQWWLKLPPTNLIRRDDLLRFRHGLFMMMYQTVCVLYSLNNQPQPATFSNMFSCLEALFIAPEACGVRFEQMVSAGTPDQAWSIAAGIIKETLDLAGCERVMSDSVAVHPAPSVAHLHTMAEAAAQRHLHLHGLDAVTLSGSLARDTADRLSDIDLSIYCRRMPSQQDRAAIWSVLPGVTDLLVEHACDTAWLDETLIHVRYWISGDAERMIAALPKPPADIFLAEDLQICRPLHDLSGLIGRWKMQIATFSPALIAAMFDKTRQHHRALTPMWAQAISTRDLLYAYCLANQAAHNWLTALFTLNHRFLSTPRWSREEMQSFAVMPPLCEERLRSVVDRMTDWNEVGERWMRTHALWEELEGMYR